MRELDTWLAKQRAKYNQDFRKGAEASVWIALDRGGHMRGMDPPYQDLRHRYFGYRDYFTGLGYNSNETRGPPKAIVTGPHRSVVYRRRSTKTWAVTFSVPVYSADNGGEPIGVLGMSVDLNQEETPGGVNRFSTLVDTHPDANGKAGLVVRHPYMASLPSDSDDEHLPLYYSEQLVELAKERPSGWQLQPEYHDPVEREPFDGLWLAAVEPVIVRSGHERPVDTGFLIVVQERRDEVMEPVRALQWRLTYGAIGAALFVLGLLALLTVGVTSVLDGGAEVAGDALPPPLGRACHWNRRHHGHRGNCSGRHRWPDRSRRADPGKRPSRSGHPDQRRPRRHTAVRSCEAASGFAIIISSSPIEVIHGAYVA